MSDETEVVFNAVERECLILSTAWAMIGEMVNWAVFVKNDRTTPTDLRFQTSAHAKLFNIHLGDFLSELRPFRGSVPFGLDPAPAQTRKSNLTFIFYLREVVAHPRLGYDTGELSEAIEAFADWLEGDAFVRGVNLSDINVVADLTVMRYRYLKICGDLAKHNVTRLATNAKHIREIITASGHSITEQESYIAMEGFFEWFHDNVFIYHSSMIAEFLNNIRWAIYGYLRPEFARSWHVTEVLPGDLTLYAYRYPEGCEQPAAKAMYWDLMNHQRYEPYVHRIKISESMKSSFLPEPR